MKKLFCLLLCGIFLCIHFLGAQTPEFPPVADLTPETLFQSATEPLYTGLVILWGYLSGFIPGINRYRPFVRVLAFGLVTGLGFALFGGASVWKIAVSYFLSSGLYITFFKEILPSPKAKPVLGAGA